MPPVDDDLVGELTKLAHHAAAQPEEGELHRRLIWLVDVLIARGQLAPVHRRIIEKIKDGRPSVHLAVVQDKRQVPSPDVDCARLLSLCKGRCCSFRVALSTEDLHEGRLKWRFDDPYLLRKHPVTGYCENLRRDGGCGVYEDRPATCRSYDCRRDPRVWVDFEARIPAPMTQPVVALDEWPDGIP